MRRPLPPELLVLGDQLEIAARRQLGRRRTHRNMILNALAGVAVAIPLLATTLQAARAPVVTPEVVVAPSRPSFGHKGIDAPPRLLHHVRHSNDDVLGDDTTLRRALR